jgi:filamentous hemagglutinin family protein
MKTQFWRSLLTLTNVVIITQPAILHANAQTYQPTNRSPVADNTLGTQVSGTGNNFDITGGVNRGQTLFHSFTDFSVPTNGQANFTNPVGNRDIITRVTGNLFSDINGTVNSNGANFFLINPNGIVFGTNARLNVGKAFVGSTANSLDLVDAGGRAITFGTNPNGDAPLLSIAPNVLFDVSRLNLGGGTGAISNFGTLQTPNNSQYIGLIGGNVTLDGGKIIAPGGRVDIGGLSGVGSVSVDNNGLVFSGVGVGRSNVVLTNDAGIIVRATETLDTVSTFFNNATSNGSSINISANNLDLLNSGAKLTNQPAALDAGLEVDSGLQTKAAGNINIDATGNVSLNNADIKNTLRSGAEGNIGGIKIQAGTLDINNNSIVSTSLTGKGNAGNIDLKTSGGINLINKSFITSSNTDRTAQGNAGDINITANGDIKVSGYDVLSPNPTSSSISSSTSGQGDAGKITIDTQGKLSVVNDGNISSDLSQTAVGNGRGIKISARELEIANYSSISTITLPSTQVNGKGNAGDIDIKTTGDIRVFGSDLPSTTPTRSYISSGTQGYGDTGKITIDTQGKLSVVDNAFISSSIAKSGVGNSKGINITAREIKIANNSSINTSLSSNSQGNAGDITIATIGDILLSGYESFSLNPNKSDSAFISSSAAGQGDAGKITIDTQGKLSILNNANITSSIESTAIGNSKEIKITARSLELANSSLIFTDTLQTKPVDGKGNAGDINIKTTGDIKISGYDSSAINPTTSDLSQISSSSIGQGNTGKITIDTQGKLSLSDRSLIFGGVSKQANGNGRDISIAAREIELNNQGFILSGTDQIAQINGKGKSGDVILQAKDTISLNNDSAISTSSTGAGQAGNVSVTAAQLLLLNDSRVLSNATSVSGGNVTIALSDKLLLRNVSFITTTSGSSDKNGNGGNITISSPLIIALPGNNDIIANAYQGTGGKVNIASQGLFGIQYRPIGSPFTNDITSSSTFGQNGSVNITTPGTDPGRDSTELPNTTTDASNQISQTCSTNNRENKLTVAGRGGLPPNANDPLTNDLVWQDARATSSQPAVSSTNNPVTLVPPAVGWVFDGKGKATLVAAATPGQPTGTSVACPQGVGK